MNVKVVILGVMFIYVMMLFGLDGFGGFGVFIVYDLVVIFWVVMVNLVFV